MKIDTKVVAIVLLVVVAVTATATLAAFAQSRRATKLEAELAAAQADTATALRRLKVATAELDQLRVASSATSTPDTAPVSPDEPEQTEPASTAREDSTTQKKFAFVGKGFREDSAVWLALDYAEFLTDPDAIKAATTKTGDEYPPPNDYYIYNPNAKLREFRFADDATVTIMLYGPEDTEKLTPEEFLEAFTENADQVADAGYWVTIEDGEITRLVEQWAP